ncbi:heme-binding domain-containing protein [Lutibacter sp.]
MGKLKRMFLLLFIAFVGIQFIPTKRNVSNRVPETNFNTLYNVPEKIQVLLKQSCYDCHSNNTNYPWYNTIQPIRFMLETHIANGKKELNFDVFGNYSKRKQKNKLKAIASQVKDGEMPLWSYTIIHKKAALSEEDKNELISWIVKLRDSL